MITCKYLSFLSNCVRVNHVRLKEIKGPGRADCTASALIHLGNNSWSLLTTQQSQTLTVHACQRGWELTVGFRWFCLQFCLSYYVLKTHFYLLKQKKTKPNLNPKTKTKTKPPKKECKKIKTHYCTVILCSWSFSLLYGCAHYILANPGQIVLEVLPQGNIYIYFKRPPCRRKCRIFLNL